MKQIGWIKIDAKEAKNVMDAWGSTDIKRVAASMAFTQITGLSNVKGENYDFEYGKYKIRMSVQEQARDFMVPESAIDDADIHVMVYWNDWHMIFMGWQWTKVLKGNPPRKEWSKSNGSKFYFQAIANVREIGDLMMQLVPEKMPKDYVQEEIL